MNDLIEKMYLKWRRPDHNFNAVIRMKLVSMVNIVTLADYFKNESVHYPNNASMVAVEVDCHNCSQNSVHAGCDTFYY